jgi:uncharacterized membrane protein YbjE (DUF340 family)
MIQTTFVPQGHIMLCFKEAAAVPAVLVLEENTVKQLVLTLSLELVLKDTSAREVRFILKMMTISLVQLEVDAILAITVLQDLLHRQHEMLENTVQKTICQLSQVIVLPGTIVSEEPM